jgi:hypothetical protein
MSGEIEPVELARLVDFAERSRVDDWSLRSSVVRFAQAEPERAARILECVRRTDGALHAHERLLRTEGPELWRLVTSDGHATDEIHRAVVDLLAVASGLDQLGEVLASWAAAWPAKRPVDDVDKIVIDVEAHLDGLGVPAEAPPPRSGFDRGGRRPGAERSVND